MLDSGPVSITTLGMTRKFVGNRERASTRVSSHVTHNGWASETGRTNEARAVQVEIDHVDYIEHGTM
jgi:hypothetical protein